MPRFPNYTQEWVCRPEMVKWHSDTGYMTTSKLAVQVIWTAELTIMADIVLWVVL